MAVDKPVDAPIRDQFPDDPRLRAFWDSLPTDKRSYFNGNRWGRQDTRHDVQVGLCFEIIRAAGLSLDDALALCCFPNGLGSHQPLHDTLMRTAWAERDRAEAAEAAERRNSPILRGADFTARHVPPVWLVDGVIQRSRLYACTSLTGHGKTAVWLYAGCMIAAARSLGGLRSFPGNVLYLAGENPSDLEARMIGVANEHRLSAGQLPYVRPGAFPMTEEGADRLKQEIQQLKLPLALIIGDTASSFFPGDDENANAQAGAYARLLRTFTQDCLGNPAVVALCHPVKNATRDNLLPRGGGAFLNELDGNTTLWSDVPGQITELHWQGKIRGPDFAPLGFRLRTVETGLIDENGRREETIIAAPMGDEEMANFRQQALADEDVVLQALKQQPDLSWANIARQAGWVNAEGAVERWKVQRSIEKLKASKLVKQDRVGGSYELTDSGVKALEKRNHGARKAATND